MFGSKVVLLSLACVAASADALLSFDLVGSGRCVDSNNVLVRRYGEYIDSLDKCEDLCSSVESACIGIAFNHVLAVAGGSKKGYCSIYSTEKPEKAFGPFDSGEFSIVSADGVGKWKCYRARPCTEGNAGSTEQRARAIQIPTRAFRGTGSTWQQASTVDDVDATWSSCLRGSALMSCLRGAFVS
mmetsp:Transcript_9623/g.34254  ORF Transcript_9623/g.34254 Transcript_9623/m.34254 type:complete len:185 (+) Transcript_9623:119-673(+)